MGLASVMAGLAVSVVVGADVKDKRIKHILSDLMPRRRPLSALVVEKCGSVRNYTKVKDIENVKGIPTDTNALICELCNTSVRSEIAFRNHLVKCHLLSNFVCPVCPDGRTFRRIGNLRTHLKLHEGTRPFACKYCNRTFTQKQTMQQHEKRHTGEKPFVCGHCGARFRQKGALIAHTRMYLSVRPFVCRICNKSFSELSNLRQHAITHTGRKPYQCQVCKRQFNRNFNLLRHLELHRQSQPTFSCNTCLNRFRQKSALQRHCDRYNHVSSQLEDEEGLAAFAKVHVTNEYPANNAFNSRYSYNS
mmetsp:Transcript_12556/g.18763  ORF Transcript_12556/g.18763 Transcript_12556/m.18763 type:complete len:305 (-) Transcript_12556:62-976(-)